MNQQNYHAITQTYLSKSIQLQIINDTILRKYANAN